MVPIAPSSTRMRSAARRRNRCSVADIEGLKVVSDIDIGSGALLPRPEGERVGVRGFGSILFKRVQNFLEHAIGVLQDVVVPKSQHQISHRFQNLGSICIFRSASCMLPAIKLDDRTRIGTTEIDDIPVNWNLSFEFQASRSPIAKVEPKHTLGVRLIATEPSRGANVSIHRPSPLTPTLSPTGRGSSLSPRRGPASTS